MYKLLTIGDENFVYFFGNTLLVWYGGVEYYIYLVLVEVVYNKKEANQKLFDG